MPTRQTSTWKKVGLYMSRGALEVALGKDRMVRRVSVTRYAPRKSNFLAALVKPQVVEHLARMARPQTTTRTICLGSNRKKT